jgi:hypothetical protein
MNWRFPHLGIQDNEERHYNAYADTSGQDGKGTAWSRNFSPTCLILMVMRVTSDHHEEEQPYYFSRYLSHYPNASMVPSLCPDILSSS